MFDCFDGRDENRKSLFNEFTCCAWGRDLTSPGSPQNPLSNRVPSSPISRHTDQHQAESNRTRQRQSYTTSQTQTPSGRFSGAHASANSEAIRTAYRNQLNQLKLLKLKRASGHDVAAWEIEEIEQKVTQMRSAVLVGDHSKVVKSEQEDERSPRPERPAPSARKGMAAMRGATLPAEMMRSMLNPSVDHKNPWDFVGAHARGIPITVEVKDVGVARSDVGVARSYLQHAASWSGPTKTPLNKSPRNKSPRNKSPRNNLQRQNKLHTM